MSKKSKALQRCDTVYSRTAYFACFYIFPLPLLYFVLVGINGLYKISGTSHDRVFMSHIP